WPSTPTSRSCGTKQSVKKMSLTSLPPIVSICRMTMSSLLVGTENIEMPSCLAPVLDVRATTRTWSAKWALEHHVFWPLRTHPSLTLSALQVSDATSDPDPGSDIAIDVGVPATTPASTSFLMSSLANLK